MKNEVSYRMNGIFYQAVYAHTNEGWAVINTSEDLPPILENDFLSFERVNAGLVSGTSVPTGDNEAPSCMYEIYFKNDAVGIVTVQYGLSDLQGRPVSFAHGFIFPESYTLLKKPEKILSIKKENFAPYRIKDEKKMEIRTTPGAINDFLIKSSACENIPAEIASNNEIFSVKEALKYCGISREFYSRLILAVYIHVIASKSESNLYIKTDGSEKYTSKLLYLIYSAVPFSMRTQLSASTYLHVEQHNTKLIFCAELPSNMPFFDPITGENNILNEILEKRTKERNPFIEKAIEYALDEKQERFFSAIEYVLHLMGNEKLDSMQVINLAYKICNKEYDNSEQLPGIIYNWGALPVANSEDWEYILISILKKAEEYSMVLGDETKKILSSRLEKAITDDFRSFIESYLKSYDEQV